MMQFRQYASEVRNDLKYGWWSWRARSDGPSLSDADRAIVADLRRTGASVTSLEALGIPGSPEILAAGDAVTDNLAHRPVPAGEFTFAADGKEIAAWPQLIRWGLDERLLAIVSAYIGMPVVYRGLTVRRDVFGGPENETRMWHRDNEDNRSSRSSSISTT